MDAVGDVRFDANSYRDLQPILDNADLSLDQKLELIAGLLNRLEPALLQRAAEWEDEEIARAFIEFVSPADKDQGTLPRTARLLNALGGRGGVQAARRWLRIDRAAVRPPDPRQAGTGRRLKSA